MRFHFKNYMNKFLVLVIGEILHTVISGVFAGIIYTKGN